MARLAEEKITMTTLLPPPCDNLFRIGGRAVVHVIAKANAALIRVGYLRDVWDALGRVSGFAARFQILFALMCRDSDSFHTLCVTRHRDDGKIGEKDRPRRGQYLDK